MPGELVPTTYDRAAWNVLEGTALPHHGDILTAEDAAQINSQYRLVVKAGDHGLPRHSEPDPDELTPSNGEFDRYDAAALVVDDMNPGDVLFLEGPGFDWIGTEPLPPASSSFSQRMAVRLGLAAWTPEDRAARVAEERAELEKQREARDISAWDYMAGLAYLKGIRVVNADLDSFEFESLNRLTGNKINLATMQRPSNAEDRALAARVHAVRENRARNIVKDYALAHPDPPEMYDIDGNEIKPQLVLAYGTRHLEGLREAYEEVGLDVDCSYMEVPMSPVAQRKVLKALGQALVEALVQQAGLSYQDPPDKS